MSTTLSSGLTPLYRYVLPWLVVIGVAVGSLSAYLHPESLNGPDGWVRDYAWLLMLVFGAVIGVVLWFVGGRVVRVVLDDDELLISDYRTEFRVALTQLEAIKGPTWTNPPRYTLVFSEPTELGRKLTFIPPQEFGFLRRSEAAAVGELRAAWNAVRTEPGSP